jgi:hypothetical protein
MTFSIKWLQKGVFRTDARLTRYALPDLSAGPSRCSYGTAPKQSIICRHANSIFKLIHHYAIIDY